MAGQADSVWEEAGDILASLSTTDPRAAGLQRTTVEFFEARMTGKLRVPKAPLYNFVVDLSYKHQKMPLRRLESDSMWGEVIDQLASRIPDWLPPGTPPPTPALCTFAADAFLGIYRFQHQVPQCSATMRLRGSAGGCT